MKSSHDFVIVDPVRDDLNESLDRHYLLSDEEIEQHMLQITTELDEIFNHPTEQTKQKVIAYLKNRESLLHNGKPFAYSSKESVQLEKIISDLDENKEQVEFEVKDKARQIESFVQLKIIEGVNFPSWIRDLPLYKQVIYQAMHFHHLGELEINHYAKVRAQLFFVNDDVKQREIMAELDDQKAEFAKELALKIYHFDRYSSPQQECSTSSTSVSSEEEFFDANDFEDDVSSVSSEEYFDCVDESDVIDFNHPVALASRSIFSQPLDDVTDEIKISQKGLEPEMQPSTLDVSNILPAPVLKTYGPWWNSLDYMCQQHSGKLLISTLTLAAGALLFHFMPTILAATGIAAIFLHIVLPALIVAIGGASTMWIAKDSHEAAQSTLQPALNI
jgi:hypothetical protein